MDQVITGLDQLRQSVELQQKFAGRIGYLCNSASVDQNLVHGIDLLKKIFGKRFQKVFSPQHGLFADEQDNMLESPHTEMKAYDVKVYSLYSETRAPQSKWLEDLDHMIIDLQDVGTRVYTFIYTAALTMIECGEANVKVTILDRPNPIGGEKMEGNILDREFSSFVGLYPIPMRHGLTIGEFALLVNRYFEVSCELEVIPLQNWKRFMYFDGTGLPWVIPSPNFPSLDTAMLYPGNVLLEGTNLSEGRGTVKPFEIFGHPEMDPFEIHSELIATCNELGLEGFTLRPLFFKPTFQKHQDKICGGFQLHVVDREIFQSWHTAQIILKWLFNTMDSSFSWNPPPYEYEYEKMPIDILNGTDQIRKWIEASGDFEDLLIIENKDYDIYRNQRDTILLYS